MRKLFFLLLFYSLSGPVRVKSNYLFTNLEHNFNAFIECVGPYISNKYWKKWLKSVRSQWHLKLYSVQYCISKSIQTNRALLIRQVILVHWNDRSWAKVVLTYRIYLTNKCVLTCGSSLLSVQKLYKLFESLVHTTHWHKFVCARFYRAKTDWFLQSAKEPANTSGIANVCVAFLC